MSAGDDDLVNSDRLREQAAGQRAMVRWWAAECRQRNAACRRRFSAANVAAATEARAILRDYARAWRQTRELVRRSAYLGSSRDMGSSRKFQGHNTQLTECGWRIPIGTLGPVQYEDAVEISIMSPE